MNSRLPAFFAVLALSLSACGGGGGGGGGTLPGTPGGAAPTPPPAAATPTPQGATPTPKPTPTPKTTPTPVGATPTPKPTATPTPPPQQSYYPADPQSVIGSTYGKIGLAQIFDYYPSYGTNIPTAQAQADASRYNFVWGSFDTSSDPSRSFAWRQGNPSMLVSRYYIIEEDNNPISGHDINYWKQNDPTWILYACDSNGNMTNDYAYTPGDGFPDVVLNFEDPNVRAYQYNNLIGYAKGNGYTTLALDEVITYNFMWGGNPNLGQTVNKNEYACGTRNADGSPNIIYASKTDPKFGQDVLNWVSGAYQAAHQNGLTVAVNHPAGNPSSTTEQAMMSVSDVMLDEAGFTDYGTSTLTSPGLYNQSYAYMEAVQSKGVAAVDIDRFDADGQTVTSNHIDYAIATYELVNEGNLDLFVIGHVGPGYGYGAENYHPEYQTALGPPCTAAQNAGGSIYYRRFARGLAVANVGSSSPETFTLPSNHTYVDIEGRAVTNPLSINTEDGYTLTTSGNGCQ